jgi:hypothetical protein
MDEDTLSAWHHILGVHRNLPVVKQERTFMQISGYPHYENVCSNILAFFLDPQNEHELDDLVLKALLQTAKGEEVEDVPTAQVEREFHTRKGNRLDLLVTTQRYVIGIENKLYHHLDNDLLDYEATLKELAVKSERELVCVVLSLHDIKREVAERNPRFINITYEQLFERIKSLSGHYAVRGRAKYFNYLNEFIQTIEDLQGTAMANSELQRFFQEQHEEIERIGREYKRYKNDLANDHIPALKSHLVHLSDREGVIQWVWNKYDLVHDFLDADGNKFYLDALVRPGGWTLLFGARNKNKTKTTFGVIQAALEAAEGRKLDHNKEGRCVIAKFSLEDSHEEIAATISRVAEVILEALRGR